MVVVYSRPRERASRHQVSSRDPTELPDPMLEALGNLGEFVGAVGVVVSLVYLARQMGQNTLSVRAASFNSMIQNSIRLLEHSFRDGEFADFLARAEADPAALSPAERLRWDSYMTAVFRHFGNLTYQARVGALDEQMWEAYRQDLKEHLRAPSWAGWFLEHREVFNRSLVNLVDETLADMEREEREGTTPPEERTSRAGSHGARVRRPRPTSGPDAPAAGPGEVLPPAFPTG